MKELVKKLSVIQQKLKAKKSQYNAFGKYSYRSMEDILEAVKPLLGELVLKVSDEVVLIGERYYVKAISEITDGENTISSVGFAREPESQKGMSEPQCSGSASTYARKYSLNGLFSIDDSSDPDSQDNTKSKSTAKKVETKKTESKVSAPSQWV